MAPLKGDPLDPPAHDDGTLNAADPAPAPAEASAASLLAEGKALCAQRKWTDALEVLRAALAADPHIDGAWLWISLAEYSKRGGWCEAQYEPLVRLIERTQQARALIRAAGGGERDPLSAKAHCKLGNLLMSVRKEFADAEETFRDAIPRDEEFPMANYNLGVLVTNVREDYAPAEEHFRAVIDLDPEYAQAHNNLGRLMHTAVSYTHLTLPTILLV